MSLSGGTQNQQKAAYFHLKLGGAEEKNPEHLLLFYLSFPASSIPEYFYRNEEWFLGKVCTAIKAGHCVYFKAWAPEVCLHREAWARPKSRLNHSLLVITSLSSPSQSCASCSPRYGATN